MIRIERRGLWPFRRWEVSDDSVAGLPPLRVRSLALAVNRARDWAGGRDELVVVEGLPLRQVRVPSI